MSSSLKIGVTLAVFHSLGIVPKTTVLLKIWVSALPVEATLALSNFAGIPSIPVDFIISSAFNSFLTKTTSINFIVNGLSGGNYIRWMKVSGRCYCISQFVSYVDKELVNDISNVFAITDCSPIIWLDFINKTPDPFGSL